jgi:hypothetical protein
VQCELFVCGGNRVPNRGRTVKRRTGLFAAFGVNGKNDADQDDLGEEDFAEERVFADGSASFGFPISGDAATCSRRLRTKRGPQMTR